MSRVSGCTRLAAFLAWVSVTFLTGCTTIGPERSNLNALISHPELEKIATATHATGFNGIVFVALRDQVLEKAFGLLSPASTQPLRPDSIFRFASISKQVTAILVMRDVTADGGAIARVW